MQSFLLVACMVTFVTFACAQDDLNCMKECMENSDCEGLEGPCTMCKAIKGRDEMRCGPPRREKPGLCGMDCSSDDECQTKGRINPCPSCQPRSNGEGSACVPRGNQKGWIILSYHWSSTIIDFSCMCFREVLQNLWEWRRLRSWRTLSIMQRKKRQGKEVLARTKSLDNKVHWGNTMMLVLNC